MTGETRVYCDSRRLKIANFADHDDVRRLAQDRTQRSWERHADLRIDLHLVDACHLVLDRLFHGDDFAVRFVDVIEAGVERRRFSRACRSSHRTIPSASLIRRSNVSWSSEKNPSSGNPSFK